MMQNQQDLGQLTMGTEEVEGTFGSFRFVMGAEEKDVAINCKMKSYIIKG